MSEELIIKHCSPTLAGIKTGNLFSCSYTSKKKAVAAINRMNSIFVPKGVRILPLKFDGKRMLVYVFRPSKLAKDLSDKNSCELLKSQGYRLLDVKSCIFQLRRRINAGSDFPHEIGLFLGYPPEDVRGFIFHKGNCCKCLGCWKVYGDKALDEAVFAGYRKCREVYGRLWRQGKSVLQLTVAV